MTRKSAAVVLVTAIAVFALALVSPAVAGKGGNHPAGGGGSGSGSSLSLVLLDSTDGLPHLGQHVTFNVSTTATTRPWVNVNCYQGGTLVYGEWHGFFPEYLYGQTFTLGPTRMWQSGGADCTAALVSKDGNRDKILKSIGFYVYP